MKSKKLSIADFTGVGVDELLAIKGGLAMSILVHGETNRSGGGGCAGDSNGFGSTFDANEVVVTGTYTGPCIVCDQSNDYVDEGFASVGRRLAHALGLHRPQPYKSPCN